MVTPEQQKEYDELLAEFEQKTETAIGVIDRAIARREQRERMENLAFGAVVVTAVIALVVLVWLT